MRSYELTIAFDASVEEKQLFILKTVFFNNTKIQFFNNVALTVCQYVRETGANLKYVEAVDFYSREAIDLPDVYPKPITKGVIKART